MKNIFVSILVAVLVSGIIAEGNTTEVPIQEQEVHGNSSDSANLTNIVSSNHVNVTNLTTIPTDVVNATKSNTTRSEKNITNPAPSITSPPTKLPSTTQIGNDTNKSKINTTIQINTSSNTSLTNEKILSTLSTVFNKGTANTTSGLVKAIDASLITSDNATTTAAGIPVASNPTTATIAAIIATTPERTTTTSLPLTDGVEDKEISISADPNFEEGLVPKPPLRMKPEESSGSNFPVFFLFSILSVVGGYFLYHNKSKVLGLIIEGTGSRRSPRYNRLRNVEEAMPGMRTTKNV